MTNIIISKKLLEKFKEEIDVEHIYPPIGDRDFDYCASWKGTDGDDMEAPRGWGKSEDEAIKNLIQQTEFVEFED